MGSTELYSELIDYVKREQPSKDKLAKKKQELCKKHGVEEIPSDITIMLHSSASDREIIKKYLLTKPVRTQSGVSVVAIMTKPIPCPHGKCTYCPGGLKSPYGDVPQSYTGKEPSTMRGIRNDYESYHQVFTRLEQYVAIGHKPTKVELIIMGGTFTAFPSDYQEDVVKYAFKAMNDFSTMFYDTLGQLKLDLYKEFFELPGDINDPERAKRIKAKLYELKGNCELEEEQTKNETSHMRCVGLTIETKPDWAFEKDADTMLRFGCTRVELGVQSVYDDVLLKTHRGHTLADTIKSIRILKDSGFKINAHYMPGSPLTDRARDLAGLKQLFSDPNFRPDMLKLYPCMVAPGTALYAEYKTGKFVPLSTEEAASLIHEFQPFIPTYCRVQRVNRDVPTKQWTAGVGITNLKQYMDTKYGSNCRCIRCREPKGEKINTKSVQLLVQEYEASGGKEYFISVEDVEQDKILGFCRLRFPGSIVRPEVTSTSAFIRELHVYGVEVPLGEEGEVQHRGYGSQLVQKAEEIARAHGKNKMIVISGVGVREYYRKKHGYEREGPYMVKGL